VCPHAGSCIDGRLTSAWNWCSQIEKKPYYHIFKVAGAAYNQPTSNCELQLRNCFVIIHSITLVNWLFLNQMYSTFAMHAVVLQRAGIV
jgi:Protein of unknown function (DUF2009)